MDHGGNPAKNDNHRYAALTGGKATVYYLARRYFNLTPEGWDDLPWYTAVAYIDGLKAQGVLDGEGSSEPSVEVDARTARAPRATAIDLSGMDPLPRNIQTRRAG